MDSCWPCLEPPGLEFLVVAAAVAAVRQWLAAAAATWAAVAFAAVGVEKVGSAY